MKFKVFGMDKLDRWWWLESNRECTQDEALAYVFDSEDGEDMANVNADFVKDEHRVKVVNEEVL
jgi:hypothetical protein